MFPCNFELFWVVSAHFFRLAELWPSWSDCSCLGCSRPWFRDSGAQIWMLFVLFWDFFMLVDLLVALAELFEVSLELFVFWSSCMIVLFGNLDFKVLKIIF